MGVGEGDGTGVGVVVAVLVGAGEGLVTGGVGALVAQALSMRKAR
jgi:hypothetical protein